MKKREKDISDKLKGNALDLQVLKRLIVFIKPYKLYFYLLVFVTFISAVLAPALPLLISRTIDRYVSTNDLSGLQFMLWLMLGVLVAQSFFQYASTYLSGWLGQSIIKDIRIVLFQHIVKLRLKFFDKTPVGRLVTRSISDIETLSDVFSQGLATIAGELLQLVFIVAVMFYQSWELTLVSLSTLPLLIISTYIFKEKIKVAFNEVRNAVSNLNTFVQEHITGMSIVQIFGRQKSEMNRFESLNEEHKKANLKSVQYYSIYFPVAEVIGATGIGLLVWFGAKSIIEYQEGTVGELVMFIMYINMFFRPIRLIADRFNTLQLGVVSTERIVRLLDNEEHIPDEGTYKPDKIKGDVVFKNVYFAYEDDDYVLKDISFSANAGASLALVGATGAGKSSIINLISRFYEINKGEITIDGKSIREYELNTLRENIGVVMQDVFLFSDTIRENIRLGNEDITDDIIWNSIEQVGAKEFIDKLPGKLDYNVQERGGTLSVGQRQLISFLRAMVYDPKIIILDEATSSVDTETELLIQEATNRMMEGRTSIVIAHRLSTIQKADNIIVLDKGELKEAGSHEELMEKEGWYHQLHKMQYKESF